MVVGNDVSLMQVNSGTMLLLLLLPPPPPLLLPPPPPLLLLLLLNVQGAALRMLDPIVPVLMS
jgi:hypothetical protein